MKPTPPITTREVALAIISVAATVAVLLVLWSLSRPAQSAERLARVNKQVADAAKLETRGSTASQKAANALCGEDLDDLAVTYPDRVEIAASASGVTINAAQVEPGETGGPLLSAAVTLDAQATQEGMVNFLSRLSEVHPTLFVRRLDLTPLDGMVQAKLEGVIWCVG